MKQTQWQPHIDAFNKSGLSKREYAENHQLIYHQFVYWSQKLNKAASKAFIPVTVTSPTVTTKPKTKSKPVTKPQATMLNPARIIMLSSIYNIRGLPVIC